MEHGLEAYFRERARFERRISLTVAVLSAVCIAPFLLALALPGAARPVRESVDEVMRFGFEGPEQYVRRIELQMYGTGEGRTLGPQSVQPIVIPETHRGGGDRANAPAEAKAFSEAVHRGPRGEGASDADLMARALLRAGDTPVFRSEDLVIERLVRPSYPERAREEDLEGRVVIMALVDTLGAVADVQLMSGEAGGLLEEAALRAARETRFRPFRVHGEARTVYAVFRFVFRLY